MIEPRCLIKYRLLSHFATNRCDKVHIAAQKCGPGAAKFANELSKSWKLFGLKANGITLNVGSIVPRAAPSSNTNSSGLAMRVSLRVMNFLLVGDADYDFVASSLKLPVDGLAATHHGALFLSAWTAVPRPKQALARCILSFGKGNSYGHPHPDSCTAANSILLDHFVGAREQRRGYLQAERNRRNQVDDQLELYRLLHR
jgi:hypothetical protein